MIDGRSRPIRTRKVAWGIFLTIVFLLGWITASSAVRSRISHLVDRADHRLLASGDSVAAGVRGLLDRRLAFYFKRKHDRSDVRDFYQARGFEPLWVGQTDVNARAGRVIGYLKGVASEGLKPADYLIDDVMPNGDPGVLAQFELSLTGAVLDYARDAESGRLAYSSVSPDIDYRLSQRTASGILRGVAADPENALAAFNPPHAGYRALKAQLADLNGANATLPAILIDRGPDLEPGMRDPRVVQLRSRFSVGDWDNQEDVYTGLLVKSVRDFQASANLRVNGVVDAKTTDAMNAAPRLGMADAIIANMERWRWMPRDLGETRAIVNIPDFSLRVERDNVAIWQTRVIVGQRELPTPILSAMMTSLTLNPTWNVPQSIVERDYLPALRRDPSIFERLGIKYETRGDGTMKFYQLAGDMNALGSIRFNFPNRYFVYQHDTPDRTVFGRPFRAVSHGCVRVEQPLTYAEIVLANGRSPGAYSRDSLSAMLGSTEQTIDLPHPVPVHLTYQTAFVDEQGTLQFRSDLYDYDAKTVALLAASHRASPRPIHMPMSFWQKLSHKSHDLMQRFEHMLGISAIPDLTSTAAA